MNEQDKDSSVRAKIVNSWIFQKLSVFLKKLLVSTSLGISGGIVLGLALWLIAHLRVGVEVGIGFAILSSTFFLVLNLSGILVWQQPGWLSFFSRFTQFFSRLSKKVIFSSLGLVLLTIAGYSVFLSLPQPVSYQSTHSGPFITPLGETLEPSPLYIDFDPIYDGRSVSASVAKLELVGKEVTSGITMSPEFAGTWYWESESRLRFEPKKDWLAGQEYDVSFAASIFKTGVKLSENNHTFKTPSFKLRLDSFQFYQDPKEKKSHKVIATLKATHPTDIDTIRDKLTLIQPLSGKDEGYEAHYEFDITYDKHQREIYISSEPLLIRDYESYMYFTLDEGAKPLAGPSVFEKEIKRSINIPSVDSFFRVESTKALLVKNKNDESEQALVIDFTDQISSQDVIRKITAYILPKTDSRGKRKHWSSSREIKPSVLKRSQKVRLTAVPTVRDTVKLHSFTFDAPENRQMYIHLDEGLKSANDFVMANIHDRILRTPSYPKEVNIMSEGAILSKSGDHKLSFLSRGIKAIKVDVGKVHENQINHLISQTYGDITSPEFNTSYFTKENISTLSTKYIQLKTEHPKKAVYSSLDLSDNYHSSLGLGLFFIDAQAWNPSRSYAYGREDQRLILITDLGILVKKNEDGSYVVFVQSIKTGEAVTDAKVSLLGKNGLAILHANTKANGHAYFDNPSSFRDAQEPVAFVVRSKDDVSFIPYNQRTRAVNYSRFNIGGESSRHSGNNQIDAFVFSDRGIYRPGDEVNLAAIVKRKDFDRLGDIPLELKIVDPKGATVFKEKVRLDKYGLLDFNFKTEYGSATGTYNASVQFIKRNYNRRQLGSTSFKVEEFQPDRLKIRSEFSEYVSKGWVTAPEFKALVNLENLFGTPAQNRRITANLELTPTGFYFKKYSDYAFSNPNLEKQNVLQKTEELDETKTDDQGKAEFDIDLTHYEAGTYRLGFTVQGYEEGGGRSVRSSSAMLVSPVSELVGYKADGDLSYITKKSKRTVEFININSNVKQVARDELSLNLIERQYVSTLVQQNNGTYKYQSVRKDKPVKTERFTIGENGSDYVLPTSNAGEYLLELVDSEGNTLSSVSFTVIGAGNLAGKLEKNAELQLQLNKKDYKPGETIEMSIVAPYTGSGLITIETDRVHAFTWFKSTTTSSVQSIRLPDNIEGNAYVNVSFVRDLESKEIFTSPLSSAVKPFSIDRSKRTVKLDFDVPEKVKPGEALTISYQSEKPSRVILFAVDEGILQVAKYQTPKPLNHFLQKRALEVKTMQIVDLILPEFHLVRELAATGGGFAEEMSDSFKSKKLNPFARKVEKPVAFWSGILSAGPEAKEHSFTIPDTFSGRLRVMAVAVNDVGIGVKESKTLVRGPFVLTPNALTAAAPGDEFDVVLGVANGVQGSGKQHPIEVEAVPSNNLQIIGAATTTLKIDENSESKFKFRVKVLEKLGAASITFQASSGKESIRRTTTLSVRPPVPYVSSFESGFSQSGKENISVPRELYADLAENTITASRSPLALIDGLVSYLNNFPHMCTEQVISSVFPILSYLEHPSYMGNVSSKYERLHDLIDTLRRRQLPDGSFMLWPGNTDMSVYSTLYAMHFLLDAKEVGVSIPTDMWKKGFEAVRSIARSSRAASNRNRAYAIYLLTRKGDVTTNYLFDLEKNLKDNYDDVWRHDISSVFIAATYKLMKAEDKAESLVEGYQIGEGEVFDHWNAYDSRLAHDGQYIYLLSRHFSDRLVALEEDELFALVQPIFEKRYNTLSSAWSVLAMSAYSKAVLPQGRQEDVNMLAVDKDGVSKALTVFKTPYPKATFLTAVDKIELSSEPRSFYMMSQSGFDTSLPTEALSNGLEIVREYQDDDGNPVSSIAQGEELNVVLRVRSTTGKDVSNVAVIDLLPGGFEVLRNSVQREYGGWSSDYREIREDRVVFYGDFGDSMTELTYKVKLTSSGNFVVPPAYAESMYDLSVKAYSKSGRFDVTSSQ